MSMTKPREIARNVASLVGGGMLGKVCRFLGGVHVANVLGADALGTLGAVFGVAMVVAVGADLGLSQYAVRRLSRRGEDSGGEGDASDGSDKGDEAREGGEPDDLALNVALLKGVLVAAVSGVALVAVSVLPLDPATRTLAFVAVVLLPTNEIVFEWVFEGLKRVALSGLYRTVLNVLFLGGVWYFVRTSEHAPRVILVDAAASVAAVASCVILWPGIRRHLQGSVRLSQWGGLLRGALAFGVANLLVMSLSYVGVFALVVLSTSAEAGLYRAAGQFVFGIVAIGFLVSRGVYPVLSRLAREEAGALERTMAPVFRIIFALALPAGIGLALVAVPTVALLYKPEFARASSALAVMAVSIPVGLATIACHYALLAYGRPGMRVRGLVLHIGVELTLGAILIPSHGCLGAAIAQVVAQGADLAFAFVVLVRIERMTMRRHALLPAIACLPMAGAVILAREHGLAAGIAAGVASYGVVYAIVLLLGRWRADMTVTSDHENAHEHEDGSRRS